MQVCWHESFFRFYIQTTQHGECCWEILGSLENLPGVTIQRTSTNSTQIFSKNYYILVFINVDSNLSLVKLPSDTLFLDMFLCSLEMLPFSWLDINVIITTHLIQWITGLTLWKSEIIIFYITLIIDIKDMIVMFVLLQYSTAKNCTVK